MGGGGKTGWLEKLERHLAIFFIFFGREGVSLLLGEGYLEGTI
jgi:hypothetical protein